ncbi:MAG: hypothetical protein AABY94_11065, partial [Nitrospirota bacterium]
MLAWSRPDPLTRDLIHLINARRHDHGDTDAAIDTLQAFLEQGRESDLLTVLAALDEEMAEWLFDLLAEASCTLALDESTEEKPVYATMAALELPLQANLTAPLKLKIDPIATAELLHRHLRLSAGTVVRVESRLLTDATLEPLNLQMLHDHLTSVADSERTQAMAARLYPPVENTAFLLFEIIGASDPGLPDSWE